MRVARDWYFLEFHPETRAEVDKTMMGEHSGHLRMVIGYWEMAAALVQHGAIAIELFNDTNSEHIGVFSKLEPFLGEMRSAYGPQFFANLEKLIDATPQGRERVAAMRERARQVRAELARMRTQSAAQN